MRPSRPPPRIPSRKRDRAVKSQAKTGGLRPRMAARPLIPVTGGPLPSKARKGAGRRGSFNFVPRGYPARIEPDARDWEDISPLMARVAQDGQPYRTPTRRNQG